MTRALTLGMLFLFLLPLVAATDVPLGIDGRVYDLDGVTPVPNLVTVDIIGNGETISMHTGLGWPGRYSVATPWPSGTLVTVRASNPSYVVERNVTVNGIVHDFDLLLDMSLPPLAPNITSAPVAAGTEDVQYAYMVEAFDWNGDALTYAVEGPDGMGFSGTTLLWTPPEGGSYPVTVTVSDGGLTTTQSYTISVQGVNDPPVLQDASYTVPRGGTFTATLVASDPDGDPLTYGLVSGPTGLSVAPDGALSFSPPQAGTAIVNVTDGEYTDTATLTFSVVGRGGGGGRPPEIPPPRPQERTEERPRVTPPVPGPRAEDAPPAHEEPTVVRVPEPSTVVGLVYDGERPARAGIPFTLRDGEGDTVAHFETGEGPEGNGFSTVLHDVRGQRFTLETDSKYYRGGAEFTAGDANVLDIRLQRKYDPVSLTGLAIADIAGLEITPVSTGVTLVVIVLFLMAFYLYRRLRRRL